MRQKNKVKNGLNAKNTKIRNGQERVANSVRFQTAGSNSFRLQSSARFRFLLFLFSNFSSSVNYFIFFGFEEKAWIFSMFSILLFLFSKNIIYYIKKSELQTVFFLCVFFWGCFVVLLFSFWFVCFGF